jgi:hypothetical protein
MEKKIPIILLNHDVYFKSMGVPNYAKNCFFECDNNNVTYKLITYIDVRWA